MSRTVANSTVLFYHSKLSAYSVQFFILFLNEHLFSLINESEIDNSTLQYSLKAHYIGLIFLANFAARPGQYCLM